MLGRDVREWERGVVEEVQNRSEERDESWNARSRQPGSFGQAPVRFGGFLPGQLVRKQALPCGVAQVECERADQKRGKPVLGRRAVAPGSVGVADQGNGPPGFERG
jgi:hypothetical protein